VDAQRAIAERARRDIVRLCRVGLDVHALVDEVLRRLRKVVPVDVAFFATADPRTLLFTGSVVEDVLAGATRQFLENEFLQDDVNKFVQLARSERPVNGLYLATEQEPGRSPRYRDILAPLGLGDELRAALVSGSICWGFLCLHRARSSPAFTPAEAAFVGQLAPHLAEGIRGALLLDNAVGQWRPTGPGLLVLADDLTLVATTPPAEEWLEEMGGQAPGAELPHAIYAVAARLRALERGGEAPPDPMPRVRIRTRAGRWLVAHASRLSGRGAEGQTAVILEQAQPTEVAPLVLQAYHLTDREAQLTQLVLRGLSTDEIADQLCLSAHTVQQHLKAVFAKAGVRSRRALVARIFAEEYRPRIQAGVRLDADGGFAQD
jgi:DNA-binding CsgD family transcriptional regulator